jgi:hypothetical protein
VIEQGRRDRSLTGEVGGSDFVGGFEGVGFHEEDSEGGAEGGGDGVLKARTVVSWRFRWDISFP